MSRHITKTLITNLTVPATGSQIIDLDLDTVDNLQFLVSVTYTATHAASTNVSIHLHEGFGAGDSTLVDSAGDPLPFKVGGSSIPVVADNYEDVTMVAMPVGQNGSTTRRTSFYLSEINIKWSRWLRLVILNLDPSNTATISIKLDM